MSSRIGLSFFFFQTLLETIAIPLAIDNMGSVGQAIKKRGGHYLLPEDLRPVGEAEIGRDDNRPFLMPFDKNLKKRGGAF